MKKLTLLLAFTAFAIVAAIPASGQKSDFDGNWKLDRTKSTTGYYPILVKISVQVKGDSLLTERTYDVGDGQEYPFTENITLDGKEYLITIYDMPRKSRGTKSSDEGVLSVESTTTVNGSNGSEDFVSKETWKVDKPANTLTINFKNSSSEGEIEGAIILTKSE